VKVIEYLNSGKTLEDLTAELKIKVTNNPKYPDLFVLNYDQVFSPKHNPITLECRSLVIENLDGEWGVVSRAFDRFFNYGETETAYNISELSAFEKLDGSLITFFMYNGELLYRTKSMIMPEGKINDFDKTWKELIETSFNFYYFKNLAESDMQMPEGHSIICEVVSLYNRVVLRYPEPCMYFLGYRTLDRYLEYDDEVTTQFVKDCDMRVPKKYSFESMADCLEAAVALENLEEGYVLYDRHNTPVCKIKNPAYVAAHHLRGECAKTPKQIMNLIIIGETDEYLTLFPEDKELFDPYINAYDVMWRMAEKGYEVLQTVEDQKEFALKAKDSIVAPLLFGMRKGLSAEMSFFKMTNKAKHRLIDGIKSKLKTGTVDEEA